MRNRLVGILAVALLAAFLFVLIRIAILPLESGEVYPAYSSLRADPRGAKALYESLAALGTPQVSRNFEALQKLKGGSGTLLLLGEPVGNALGWSEQELKMFESLAANGARVVVAFLPEPPRTAFRSGHTRGTAIPPLVSRWHIELPIREASAAEAEKAGSLPRVTSAFLRPATDSGWNVLNENDRGEPVLVSHDFGKGQVVLLTASYPLSNEGLRAERDVDLIGLLIGQHNPVIFDETHLGVNSTGSIGTLIRRYRLTGVFGVSLLLGLLFLWKNSTSLLPQVSEAPTVATAGADAQSGLVNLLKRSVPPAQLVRACWERWKETRALGGPVSDIRVQLAERELTSTASQAAIYQKMQKILTEKT